MSSKISKVYYLTLYSFGRTMTAWPKLRYKATSAKGVNTFGFHGKGMTKNPRCVHAVNRLTGIHPASRMVKRQSGARTGLYACMSTMTVTESSCRMTKTVSALVLKQSTATPIWDSQTNHPLWALAAHSHSVLRITFFGQVGWIIG